MKVVSFLIVPKPITGMTLANSYIKKIFLDNIPNMRIIELQRFAFMNNLLWLIYKNIAFILFAFSLPIFRIFNYRGVYNIPSSNNGLIFTFIIFFFARILNMKIIHHHHVSSYINKSNKIIQLMANLGGAYLNNVFLCETMKNKYELLYGNKNHFFILDNINLIPIEKGINKEKENLTIGYLSNITIEKGFDLVVKSIDEVLKENMSIKFIIAGPAKGETEKVMMQNMLVKYPNNVKYLGPVYGEEKKLFYESIDIFLFPTKYKNEAQPLVIYEALVNSVIVLSTNRGCIQEQVNNEDLVVPDAKFVETLLALISDNSLLKKVSENNEEMNKRLNNKESIIHAYINFINRD